jgi:hypothetical protein
MLYVPTCTICIHTVWNYLLIVMRIGCDAAIATNGTSATGTQPSGWGLPDPDNSNCQTGCTRNTGEACGVNNGTHVRLSLYQFVVSGFHNNACVLKLK